MIKRYRVEILLALAALLLFAVVCRVEAPGESARLSHAEVDAYLQRLADAPAPAEEKAMLLERLRVWGYADDGRPVYMLNLMRFFDRLRPDGGLNGFSGTPAEANAYYEREVTPLVMRLGVTAAVAGNVQGVGAHSNIAGAATVADDWNRVLVVRYPSRRAFFELVSHPDYWKLLPFKLASVDLALVPVNGDVVMPDPRLLTGGLLLVLFLLTGWIRSARRRPETAAA